MPMEFYFLKDINQQAKRGLKVLFTIGYNRTGKMRIQLSIISGQIMQKIPWMSFHPRDFS